MARRRYHRRNPTQMMQLSTVDTVVLGGVMLGIIGAVVLVAANASASTSAPTSAPTPGGGGGGSATAPAPAPPGSTAPVPSATGPANQTVQYAPGQWATYDSNGNLVGNTNFPPGG
jgi:hypothetical protein